MSGVFYCALRTLHYPAICGNFSCNPVHVHDGCLQWTIDQSRLLSKVCAAAVSGLTLRSVRTVQELAGMLVRCGGLLVTVTGSETWFLVGRGLCGQVMSGDGAADDLQDTQTFCLPE